MLSRVLLRLKYKEINLGSCFTNFSTHAFDRLSERTSFTQEQLVFWLDHEMYFNLGNKPGIPKQHLLFYSPIDEEYFVAIRDEQTGTVVTVLPLKYHQRLAWEVSEYDKSRAREKISVLEFSRKACLDANKTLRVSVTFLDISGCRRTKSILKLPIGGFGFDIDQIKNDKSLKVMLKNGIVDISYSVLIGFSFRLGKSGHPIFLDLKDLNW